MKRLVLAFSLSFASILVCAQAIAPSSGSGSWSGGNVVSVDAGYIVANNSLQSVFVQAGAVDAGSAAFSGSVQTNFSQVGAVDGGVIRGTQIGSAGAVVATTNVLVGGTTSSGVIAAGSDIALRGAANVYIQSTGGTTWLQCLSDPGGCRASAITLPACTSAREGVTLRDPTGGTGGKKTKECECAWDGSAGVWINKLNTGAGAGTSTTCPDT